MKKSVLFIVVLALLGFIAIPVAFGKTAGVGYAVGEFSYGSPTGTFMPVLRPSVPVDEISHSPVPVPGFDPDLVTDTDADGVVNEDDNCVSVANAGQEDVDSDGIGDLCDDSDGDGVIDINDNCLTDINPSQADIDGDGKGDVCDDSDSDGFKDDVDVCPLKYNTRQTDRDEDGIGDDCDNCKMVPNPGQEESETAGIGEVCKTDWDGDTVPDVDDNCMLKPNNDQADLDEDGLGDACDPTCEGPNCPSTTTVAPEEEEMVQQDFGGGCTIIAVGGDSGAIFGMIFMIMAALSIAKIRKGD